MSKLICPQCRMSNCIDCREPECPGLPGFVPRTWQRPLHQITQDLERYESLLLKVGDWMDTKSNWDECGEIARLLSEEAQTIRAKQKREAPAEPAPKPAALERRAE